jgi:uncharacterized membrane protein YgdD (TMEM256/DUF423 family)
MVRLAALLGLAGVALGAFGAHGLSDRVSPAMLEVYRTGVLYHLIHAVVLLAVALAAGKLRRPRLIAGFFVAGIAVFSGSLYALALSEVRVLGAITPFGGAAFLTGWALLAAERVRS